MTKPQSRTVLITGGATRIGKHIALGLAEDGWNVAIHFNKSQADAFEVEKKINDLGVKCMTIKADLARDDAVKGLISKVRQEIGLSLIHI